VGQGAGVVTDLRDAIELLFTGADPLQEGVEAGAISRARVAVVRGRVFSPDGSALEGAVADVLGHPELGRASADGAGELALAVNGGGRLVVRISAEGHSEAQRPVDVGWREFAWLPDVVLVPLDDAVTTVDLARADDVNVARGSPVEDADGPRRGTALFPPGTVATMLLPDGGEVPLPSLDVRITE